MSRRAKPHGLAKSSAEERAPRGAIAVHSQAYQLASEDLEFLAKDDLRPLRLQLELLKPEWYLRRENIRSTIVVFGSARILPPEIAYKRVAELAATARQRRGNRSLRSELARARRQLAHSRFYEEARQFSATVSRRFQQEGRRDFVVVTGGGPGIMEAANRGAHEVGARSIAFNITLPHEQIPNRFVTPELCFRFQYFAIRKMHFLLRAKALVAFPGGYGTMDELFEVLTLVQTGKVARIPVVLVGRSFWGRAVNFEVLVADGFVSAQDLDLFHIVDSAQEAVRVIQDFYKGRPPE